MRIAGLAMMDATLSFSAFRDAIRARRRAAILSNGPESFDGLGEWRAVKESLSAEAGDVQWSQQLQSPERRAFYEKAILLPETDAEGRTIEAHHFLLQCARIPERELPSPRKVLQLALNVGQLQAEVDALGAESLSEYARALYTDFQRLVMHELDAYVGSSRRDA
jgi:hypothetical protein